MSQEPMTELPVLYVFAISHYCEKARWALDYAGVDYQLRYLAPGQHGVVAKRLGARGTGLPILETGDNLVEGSAKIIDWVATLTDSTSLNPAADETRGREIETRLDDVAGVHVRSYYYSEALIEHPETVRPIFAQHLGWPGKAMLRMGWKKIAGMMIGRMNLSAEQGRRSGDIVERELDWLDSLLAEAETEGRDYLLGNRFSRVDLTAASLFAPISLPPEHPTYSELRHPPGLAEEIGKWCERPTLRWVNRMYRLHRTPQNPGSLA